jgi:hypothetical protein
MGYPPRNDTDEGCAFGSHIQEVMAARGITLTLGEAAELAGALLKLVELDALVPVEVEKGEGND